MIQSARRIESLLSSQMAGKTRRRDPKAAALGMASLARNRHSDTECLNAAAGWFEEDRNRFA